MAQFSKMDIQLEEDSPDVCVASFKNGLRADSLNRDLMRRLARDMMDLRARVQEFIMIEQDEQNKKEREDWRKSSEQNTTPPDQHQHLASQGLNPTNMLSRDFKATRGIEMPRYPPPPRRPPNNVDTNRWCEFHKALGHTTDNRWTLRREIDRLIKAGHFANFVKDTSVQEPAKAVQDKKGKDKEVVEELGDPSGECASIAGGFGGGELSSKVRKRHVAAVHSIHKAYEGACWLNHSPITFTPQDFSHVIPHDNDPIVVTITINNYRTKKLLLDQGSSADIIYGDAFDRLGLKESDLKPYPGTLMGFTGDRVNVPGYVEILTAFGEGDFVKKFQVKYLVLACRANYNALLGCDTLNKICAVISIAHLTIKYPACNGKIGILRVDQEAARDCYLKSVALYGRKATKESHRMTEIFPQERFTLDPSDDTEDFRPQPLEETKSANVKDKVLKIGSGLSEDQKAQLIALLGKILDLFA
ncbi:uncharacterized protein LOC130736339 [Lotus japonicus]|uniref:uncharacterized protein LOC130736339 n=1 Tax=Lotus japonicus TaxID=34305 RepID=UPI00258ED160|nr:uncharacterized protein LOC130736339 [Lotus japonicus]